MNVAEIARPWAKIAGVLEVGPIRDDGHYRRLSERLHVLHRSGSRRGGKFGDRLREYDARAYPWAATEPVEALRHLMQANGLTQSDLPDVGN
jgi:antitoxin component HigA of HigAB toxin-antitoxin module